MLLALPVNGHALIGPTQFDWAELCFVHLGVRPSQHDLDGSKVKLTWLAHHFGDVTQHEHDVEQLQRFNFFQYDSLLF